jgi:hypothetical protein
MRNEKIHFGVMFLLVWMTVGMRVTQAQSPSPAQTPQNPGPAATNERDEGPAEAASGPTAVFGHSETSRFWVSGQINMVLQWHPAFRADYSGESSLRAEGENATSRVLTLYTGLRLTANTELFCDVESAGGRGISDALGVAGFTNLDVVRNPTLGSAPYLARLTVRRVIPLGEDVEDAQRGPFGLATRLPSRRLEIRAGKMSTVDSFDLNSAGGDSHMQFLNWTVDNNGAYDYAADTRGYTWGAVIEYHDHDWAIRFGEMLMPKVANGLKLDWDLARARGENLELEWRRGFLPGRAGTLRLLSFVNHANMGSYRDAIGAFLARREPVPDVTAHRAQGRVKYGFGANFEQELGGGARLFGRWGWNEGKHESFAYTEVNQSAQLGVDWKGDRWRRKLDKLGLALVSNGISGDHRRYLELGGKGFLLGDGALDYRREMIVESYYTARLWRGVFASFDVQRIANPGYNHARGPALVPGMRLHLEL